MSPVRVDSELTVQGVEDAGFGQPVFHHLHLEVHAVVHLTLPTLLLVSASQTHTGK